MRVHPQELPLVVKQPHKIMGQIGLVAAWIQLFGQSKERIWVVMEKVNLEYGLCVGQVVLPQVVIETAAWRPVEQICADPCPLRVPRTDATRAALLPEVWDAAGGADASAGHHHHPPVVLLPDALGDLLQGLQLRTCAAAVAEKAPRPSPALCLSAREQQFFMQSSAALFDIAMLFFYA